MKKLLATAAIISAMTATSASATAPKFPYWYIGLSAGVNGQTDSDVHNSSDDISWDTGFTGTVSIGYQPPALGGFRPEAEYSYRHQSYSHNGDGDSTVNGLTANLYYDFYNSSPITPYIGGGVGFANFKVSGGTQLDDSETQAIYQAMIGIGFEPQSVPNVGFNVGYRYMAPFSDPQGGTGGHYEYDNHTVEVGAKFHF